MNPANRVSVALCTYNGEKYLAQQLKSLAQQTRLPDELVVCDDCSSDSTPEMIQEFARTAPFPVRFFRNPVNLRSTKNFEQAITLCDGDFISLCDQDDIWLPEKIASELSVLEQDPTVGGVFSDADLIDASSHMLDKRLWANVLFTLREQGRFQSGHGADVLLKGNVVTGATLMFRASLRPVFMPIPAVWVHDGWIAWMLLMHSKLTFIAQPLMQYQAPRRAANRSRSVGVGGPAVAATVAKRKACGTCEASRSGGRTRRAAAKPAGFWSGGRPRHRAAPAAEDRVPAGSCGAL